MTMTETGDVDSAAHGAALVVGLGRGGAISDDPEALQDIRDRLGPGTINVFVQRWLARLPMPFTQVDQDAGYWWEISLRQVEVSRTIMFDAPRHFGRRVRRDTPGALRTAIDRRDNGGVLLNVFYRHSRIKQYLKDGRAMRIETAINHPRDLGATPGYPTSMTRRVAGPQEAPSARRGSTRAWAFAANERSTPTTFSAGIGRKKWKP